MTDEARLEKLTALAKKAWPDRNVSAVVGDNLDEIGAGVIGDADEDWSQLVIVENHPLALDALEAALHVLAGDRENFVPSFRYLEVSAECSAQRDRADAEKARADAAEEKTKNMRVRLIAMVLGWRMATQHVAGSRADDMLSACASELEDALKVGP